MIYTLQNIEYTIESGKPVIWIFARDENKAYKVFQVRGFNPYFYVRKGETAHKTFKSIYGDELQRIDVTKPSDVAKMRNLYSQTWESDIPFPIRYMIDTELYSTFKYENGIVIPVKAEPVPPRICFIDIEVGAPKGDWPDPFDARHEIICISLYDSYVQNLVTMTWHPNNVYSSETNLLESFLAKIAIAKPDIITGWNITNFDIPYVVTRMRRLGINPNTLSPLSFVHIEKLGQKPRVRIKGLTVLDLLAAYKKFFAKAFPSYSLQETAKRDLGESKIVVNDFRKTWLEDPETIINRNSLDVSFLYRINDKWKLINHYTELKTIIGATYNDVLYTKKLIDIKMLRKAREKGVILPRTPKTNEKKKYLGAYVMDPVPGIHSNVIVLDFKSLYPSIFVSYNISPETLTSDSKKTGILPECIKELQSFREETQKKMREHPVGSTEYIRLYSKQMATKFLINAFYGVFGHPNFRLYDKRVAETITRKGQECIRTTIDMIKKWGYKVLYGDTDSIFVSINGGLDEALAQGEYLSTSVTRALNFRVEFEKVYSRILFGKVKKRYAGIKVWEKGQTTNKLDVTGFEVKRSDTAPVSISIQKEIMNLLLTEDKPLAKIQDLLIDLRNRFKSLPLSDIAIPKGIKKDLDEYGKTNEKGRRIGIPAVVRGAIYANKHLGTNFGAGSKPKMLYLHMPTDVICFDEDTILPDNIIVDYDKMWNTIIIQKVEPLLEIIGKTFNDIIKKERQTILEDYTK